MACGYGSAPADKRGGKSILAFLSAVLECVKASNDKHELKAILLVLIAVLSNKSSSRGGLEKLSPIIAKSTFKPATSSFKNLIHTDFNDTAKSHKDTTRDNQAQEKAFMLTLFGEIFCAFRDKIYTILTHGDILDCSFLYLSFITPSVLVEHFGYGGCDDLADLRLDTHFRDDERFLSFVSIADKMLAPSDINSTNISQEEWIMLVELGSISRVLAFPSVQYRLKTNKNSIKTSKITNNNTKTSPAQKNAKKTPKSTPQVNSQNASETKNALVFFSAFISLSDMQCAVAQKIQPFIYEAYSLFRLDFGVLEEAIAIAFANANNALKRRNVCNWQLHIFWNVEHWFNVREWLNLYALWKDIFYERIAQARELMDSIAQESNQYQSNLAQNLQPSASSDFAPNLQPLHQCLDEVLYLQFFIYHFCGNSFVSQEQWREFNNEVLEKSSALYREFGAKFLAKSGKIDSIKSHQNTQQEPQKRPKKIIAFLRDRFVENSPFKVEYSLIKNLMDSPQFRQDYSIKIYCMSLIEKSENDLRIIKAFANLGVEIIDIGLAFNSANFYNSHLQKALALREVLLKDSVEVLISPNNGYGISDFLLSVRCAPTQVFWTHGNFVYDIRGIDERLTHICNDLGEITHEGVRFLGIPVRMDNVFYNPPVLPSEILEARENIAHLLVCNTDKNASKEFKAQSSPTPNDKPSADLVGKNLLEILQDNIILGVMGRLTKIDSIAYLEVICEILQRRKECIFLACGVGNEEAIKEKITRINPSVLSRFCFSGQIDSAVYGHIIDVWLDSFPMEQGESRIEYVAKGRGLALRYYDCDEVEFLGRLEGELESVASVVNGILFSGNSPAGNHLANPSAPLHCGARTSAPHSQDETICQSTTSLARIVDSSTQADSSGGSDSVIVSEQSERGTSLPATQVANECEARAGAVAKQNPNLCHTEPLGEVSQTMPNTEIFRFAQNDKDIIDKQTPNNKDFADYKNLVLGFSQTRAFSKEEYLQKALKLIDSTKKKDKNFQNALNTQSLIFAMGNAIKERLGVAYFMKFLEPLS